MKTIQILAQGILTYMLQITLAKNGIEGYEKFIKDNFDLCILDIAMPYKDGFTLAKEIRQKNELIPIFFYSKTFKRRCIKRI